MSPKISSYLAIQSSSSFSSSTESIASSTSSELQIIAALAGLRVERFAAEKLFELKQDDDGDLKLDEENRIVKERLKWKMEQFKHLEDAHEKLKHEFQTSRNDWEVARAALVDEV